MATKRAAAPTPPPVPNRPPYPLIEEIRVQGYKSLVDAKLHVRPLTLLAGTNSSGKSSIMQPLLLIKQTMEAPYQPAGALLLDGAHVQAETAEELVSKIKQDKTPGFSVTLSEQANESNVNLLELMYGYENKNFLLLYQNATLFRHNFHLKLGMSWAEIEAQFDEISLKFFGFPADYGKVVLRNITLGIEVFEEEKLLDIITFGINFIEQIAKILHIPGLRGLPKRAYPTTLFKNRVKGTFDLYVAGAINQWRQDKNRHNLSTLNKYLQRLGLTNTIVAKIKNANEIELSINRLPVSSNTPPKKFEKKADMVNIADVGIGVSQVLPILVALIAAQEGQIVYIEQPELHLHPKAQVVMAELLADAAKRGVRVIVETHSSLLLLTVQTLVAEGKIEPGDVGLHWFERDAKGATTVRYEQPDENGAYGEWPEDFGDVELTAQRNYLDAVTRRQPKR